MRGTTDRRRPGRLWLHLEGHRLRRALPVGFLVLSLGVAGFGALEAYRAQRSQARTVAGVLTDYGEFAAWSYQQRVHELLDMALNSNFAIVRQNRTFAEGLVTDECLEQLLMAAMRSGECACQSSPAGMLAFFFRIDDEPDDALWRGVPRDPMDRSAVVESVRHHARTLYEPAWPWAVHQVEGGPVVAYARLTPSSDVRSAMRAADDTLIYGIQLDRAKLAALLAGPLGDEVLLPPSLTRGRPNDEVLQVEIVAPDGSELFTSRPGQAHAYPAEDHLTAHLGGATVRASVLPEVAEQLVIGGLPESHAPTLFLIFALATALAVAAVVQLRREHRLGLLRQDFVASVSHELRTPLAQIRLFIETLRLGRTRGEHQKRWALENIDRETLRLTHLVERILHFSRAERGVRPLEREPVQLAEEVTDAVAAFVPLLHSGDARIRCDVPAGLVAVVSRDALRQVLLNYLDNAVRYGPAGQEIRVGGEAAGDMVRLTVADQGPGVRPGERDRIFEPYHRGERSVGSVAAGSGIGLAVVREIAHAHGGRAWVEDAPGGGARFALELPAMRTARRSHFPDTDSAAAEAGGPVGRADSEVA